MKAVAAMILTAVLLTAGDGAAEATLPFGLRHYGNFKRMMHTENVAGVVNLAQAIAGEHVYAVGALANAEGEIAVFSEMNMRQRM